MSDDELMTVDELAAATGLTVRNTRYYAGLGLLPPPERRGRVAYYGRRHRARLELLRALQAHGFTLSAIERYLGRLPADASVEDLALHQAMLTSWQVGGEPVTRGQLEERVGHRLESEEIDRLVGLLAIRPDGDRYELLPSFPVVTQILALDVPVDSLVEAGVAINRHMEELADELTEVLRAKVLAPFRERPHSAQEQAEFSQTVAQLRRLTLEAVVAGFQHAANEVVSRSLARSATPPASVSAPSGEAQAGGITAQAIR